MKNKARLLSLALALLLLLSAVPFTALADEEAVPVATHTHTFITTSYKYTYEYVNNAKHKKITYEVNTCSCGATVNYISGKVLESHYAELGSKKYLYSYLGEGGMISVGELQ